MHFMLETIIAAHLLGVDPFDQPAVEEGKVLAKKYLRFVARAAMIRITDQISIDESEIEESFVRSSGPGGQNVNKLSTAVQLRFDVRHSPSLPNDVALRLMRLGGRRITKDGVLVLIAQNHRTQERNRAEAQERLVALIQEAAVKPMPRRATKPTRASKQKRAGGQEAPLRHQGCAGRASRTVGASARRSGARRRRRRPAPPARLRSRPRAGSTAARPGSGRRPARTAQIPRQIAGTGDRRSTASDGAKGAHAPLGRATSQKVQPSRE